MIYSDPVESYTDKLPLKRYDDNGRKIRRNADGSVLVQEGPAPLPDVPDSLLSEMDEGEIRDLAGAVGEIVTQNAEAPDS